MKCPFCGSTENRVVNSRVTTDETSIRRRRECEDCKERFTTFEHVEETPLIVVKRDGTRQTLNREKMISGLLHSCEKRPVTFEQLQALVEEVEKELQGGMEREVSSMRIGQMVLTKLRSLDEVAYVRFASVYRQFRDVSEFSEEVRKLLDQSEPGQAEPGAAAPEDADAAADGKAEPGSGADQAGDSEDAAPDEAAAESADDGKPSPESAG